MAAGHSFSTTDWCAIEPVVHPGESGEARWRTKSIGALRLRVVEYTPGYVADHWCSRGHVLLVLKGELRTELNDGRVLMLRAGQSYEVATDQEAHRSSSTTGATLFIVD
ncbi:DHCW motif cupin fold protein [Agromyces italicus]|uniref:DHCW motif cupin fold protein n=1 Tax=Agromyces italicus TaxID=279572 RepID=UPI0003B57499|nr:DHCW motif cupin fold protein [Agromyces italicus]